MLCRISLVLMLACPCIAFAQLSKGEGQMVTIPGKTIKCYLPKNFSTQTDPPGIIHKESGTFVIVVKVPAEKKASVKEGLSRSFFEDPSYKIISLYEGDSSSYKLNSKGRLYTMLYSIQGHEFERKTLLVQVGTESYLIIANYYAKFKSHVTDEVEKAMANFTIR